MAIDKAMNYGGYPSGISDLVSQQVKKGLSDAMRPGGLLWGPHVQVGIGDQIQSRATRRVPDPFLYMDEPRHRNLVLTISGLQQLKGDVLTGARVVVDVISDGQVIHSEVFDGKASAPYRRVIKNKANPIGPVGKDVASAGGDLMVAHNRPDLPTLQVSAAWK